MDIKVSFYNVRLTFKEEWERKGITIGRLEEIEKSLNIIFPQEIREFYLQFNGRQLGENCCIANGVNDYFKIGDLWILDSDKRSLDFEHLIFCGQNEYWPNYLVPFANDEGGHEFCFSTRSDDYGAIYFHMSEYTGESEEVRFLAKNFIDFLSLLRPESDFLT